MATSPNYGWSEPDNTSLVKDGALAMRTLGDAIDTSVWNVGFGQAGKNKIINGAMQIWQRGTSSATVNNYATADRWVQYASSGTGTYSQDATNFPAGSRYSMKFTASSTANPGIIQVIETANALPLVGQTVTLSAFLANSTSADMDFDFGYSTTVDDAWTGTYTRMNPVSGSNTLTGITTTLSRKSQTYSIPSTAKTLRIWIKTTSSVANAVTVNWGNIQLEAGSIATPFQTASGGSIQGELAMCQRYYYQMGGVAGTGLVDAGTGHYYFATNAYITSIFPVTMRTTPTCSFVNITNWQVLSGGSGRAVTAFGASSTSPFAATSSFATAASTVGFGAWLEQTNTNAALTFSAEL